MRYPGWLVMKILTICRVHLNGNMEFRRKVTGKGALSQKLNQNKDDNRSSEK